MNDLQLRTAKKPRVFLWCVPRSLSTAFEWSIRNLKNGKIFHEAYKAAYYFGPQRASSRYLNSPPDPEATYEAVAKELSHEDEGFDFVFAKDMAYYLDGKFDTLRQSGLADYKHTFLIRHPKKTIKSLYRACSDFKVAGMNYFLPSEVGFIELLRLHDFVVNELKRTPVIIDADDLLDSPEEMMQMYCNAVGLTYEENMTTWKTKVVPAECQLSYGCVEWHPVLFKSRALSREENLENGVECSFWNFEMEDLADLLEESLHCYKVLYEKRLRPRSRIDSC